MATTFRHAAGFGRRMEYWLIGRMLREGLDVYVPPKTASLSSSARLRSGDRRGG